MTFFSSSINAAENYNAQLLPLIRPSTANAYFLFHPLGIVRPCCARPPKPGMMANFPLIVRPYHSWSFLPNSKPRRLYILYAALQRNSLLARFWTESKHYSWHMLAHQSTRNRTTHIIYLWRQAPSGSKTMIKYYCAFDGNILDQIRSVLIQWFQSWHYGSYIF